MGNLIQNHANFLCVYEGFSYRMKKGLIDKKLQHKFIMKYKIYNTGSHI